MDKLEKIFQSTRPSRGETVQGYVKRIKELFQSTRPSRGETHGGPQRAGAYGISIHSPLAGRDDGGAVSQAGGGDFNPLAPRGARHGTDRGRLKADLFQSTRPSRGETMEEKAMNESMEISIHSPLAGRDRAQGGRAGAD